MGFSWRDFEVGAQNTILSAESTIKQLVSLIESGKEIFAEEENSDTYQYAAAADMKSSTTTAICD